MYFPSEFIQCAECSQLPRSKISPVAGLQSAAKGYGSPRIRSPKWRTPNENYAPTCQLVQLSTYLYNANNHYICWRFRRSMYNHGVMVVSLDYFSVIIVMGSSFRVF